MFETLIVNPLMAILELVFRIIPGDNFGATLIVFMVLFRLALHPLIKAQVRHGKQMHDLQPQMKKINEEYKKDPQLKAKKTSELFKKNDVKPFISIVAITVQVILFIAVFHIMRELAKNPQELVGAELPRVHFTFLGLVDLTKSAAGPPFYFPAFVLVVASAVTQYFYGKQTIHERKEEKKVKDGRAKMDATDIQHYFGQFLKFAIPLVIFLFTYGLASVIALFWFLSGFIGYFQQKYILKNLRSDT